jgi:hypothetical protein
MLEIEIKPRKPSRADRGTLALICRVVYTRHARKQEEEEECRATFYFPLCCNRIHVMEGRVSVQQS